MQELRHFLGSERKLKEKNLCDQVCFLTQYISSCLAEYGNMTRLLVETFCCKLIGHMAAAKGALYRSQTPIDPIPFNIDRIQARGATKFLWQYLMRLGSVNRVSTGARQFVCF